MTDVASEIIVSQHAALRYCERVDPTLSPLEAIKAILQHSRAIEIAAAFGCSTIKLGDGARLRLAGRTVVTVLGRHQAAPFMGSPFA